MLLGVQLDKKKTLIKYIYQIYIPGPLTWITRPIAPFGPGGPKKIACEFKKLILIKLLGGYIPTLT